ncbi:MAG: low molecular weight protein-tyrosine-phosphatase [Bacteroidota bacterium]
MKNMKILMVCLGNICRSPLAEGILKVHLSKIPGEFHIDSAGTGAWHVGSPPDPRSIAAARKQGISISDQRARQLKSSDFEEFDLIFTMDESIHIDVKKLTSHPAYHAKIHLLRTYAGDTDSKVPDPYYESDEAFDNVYSLIDAACVKIASAIQNEQRKTTGKH